MTLTMKTPTAADVLREWTTPIEDRPAVLDAVREAAAANRALRDLESRAASAIRLQADGARAAAIADAISVAPTESELRDASSRCARAQRDLDAARQRARAERDAVHRSYAKQALPAFVHDLEGTLIKHKSFREIEEARISATSGTTGGDNFETMSLPYLDGVIVALKKLARASGFTV